MGKHYRVYNYEYVHVDHVVVPIVLKCRYEEGQLHNFTQLQKCELEQAGVEFQVGDLDLVFLGTYKVNSKDDFLELPPQIQTNIIFVRDNLDIIYRGESPNLQRKKKFILEKLEEYIQTEHDTT